MRGLSSRLAYTRSRQAPNTVYRLRLCMHINRDNRGSRGAAYRAGGSGWLQRVHGDALRSLAPAPGEGSFASARGTRMQMVGVYCEKRAPYEYVKWETKRIKKKKEDEKRKGEKTGGDRDKRPRDNGCGMGIDRFSRRSGNNHGRYRYASVAIEK